MLNKLFHWSEDSRFDLRERLIRRIMLIGTLVIPVSLIEVFFFTTTYWTALPLLILALTMFISLILTYKFLKVEFAVGVIGGMTVILVFPSIFFPSEHDSTQLLSSKYFASFFEDSFERVIIS